MIHLNKGENQPHEWITEEEFEKRYPDLYRELHEPRPHNEHGSKLKAMRLKRGITLREMSVRMSFPASRICDIENGKVEISGEMNDRYCLALG